MKVKPLKKPLKDSACEESKAASVMATESCVVISRQAGLHPDYESVPEENCLLEEDVIEKHIPDVLQHILLLIKKNTDHDFSRYKPQAIMRSIQRRLDILLIDNLEDYLCYLHHYPSEITVLLKCLLIHITHFFRDPDAFEILKNQLLITLSKHPVRDQSFRVWIPGCSTGEEAYSVAIILQECMSILNVQFDVQIFGTDIDPDIIESARLGIFTSNIEKHVSPERLQNFFIKEGQQYKIINTLRKTIVFSIQNIIADPPFTRVNLICCRNLLIYLNISSQNKILSSFHYGLRAYGLVLLGPSESIGASIDCFTIIDQKWRLYERKETEHIIQSSTAKSLTNQLSTTNGVHMIGKTETKLATLVKDIVSKKYTPAFIVINEKGEILYIHGRTSKFLELASGEVRLHFMSMIHPELKPIIHIGIRKAFSQQKEVILNGLQITEQNNSLYVNVTINPIKESNVNKQALLLIIIEEISAIDPSLMSKNSSYVHSYVQNDLNEKTSLLVDELEQVKTRYQSIIEELESTNEELQSINEEAQATNEELQSLNEGLSAMNAQLENRIDFLVTAKEEVKNLLNFTDIATICLDKNLCIKRFTPRAIDIINLIPADIGRPINHFVSNLECKELVNNIRTALNTLEPIETEGFTKNGQHYLIKIIPYRSIVNSNLGVVITFLNIPTQPRKKAETRGHLLNNAPT